MGSGSDAAYLFELGSCSIRQNINLVKGKNARNDTEWFWNGASNGMELFGWYHHYLSDMDRPRSKSMETYRAKYANVPGTIWSAAFL